MLTEDDIKKAEEQKITKVYAVFPAPCGGYVAMQQDLWGIKEGIKEGKERGLDLSWLERRFLTREEANEYIKTLTEGEQDGK